MEWPDAAGTAIQEPVAVGANTEVTFEESHGHLGEEPQRQGSYLAMARTYPALGCFRWSA